MQTQVKVSDVQGGQHRPATKNRGEAGALVSLPFLPAPCSPKQHNADLVFLWLCDSSHRGTYQKVCNTDLSLVRAAPLLSVPELDKALSHWQKLPVA